MRGPPTQPTLGQPGRPARRREPISRSCVGAGAAATDAAWWSRRLASGSDWMEAWIHKPARR